jgi:hypothetical protein
VTPSLSTSGTDPFGQAITGVPRVASLSRDRCRQEFQERFTAARMARDYLAVYRRLQKGEGGLGASTDGQRLASRRRAVAQGRTWTSKATAQLSAKASGT